MSNEKLEPLDTSEKAKKVVNPALPSAFIQAMQDEASKAATLATEQALNRAKILSNDIIELVTNRMNEVAQTHSSPSVLHVRINKTEVKQLSRQAPEYLGRMITNAKLGLNTLLVGPAGSGKTTAASLLAESLNLRFGHLNLTAGASETWLFGRQTPTGFVNGIFSELYETGGVFLADEMDAADPNLMLSINTAISSDSFYNPIMGKMLKRHADFVFVGAANTFGKGGNSTYVGRSRLDAATLDRFVIIQVDYNARIERELCPDQRLYNMIAGIRKEVLSVGSTEVISTRAMDVAYKQLTNSISVADIVSSMTASWPEDVKKIAQKHLQSYNKV